MAVAKTVFVATDGTQWNNEAEAIRRDALDARVKVFEAMLPEPPERGDDRIKLDMDAFRVVKTAVVELCRELWPKEAVFRHDPMEIHPASYAGRFLSECGGPLNRIWFRFSCCSDGWMYQQPFFALNPGEFRRWSKQPSAAR